MNIFKFIVNYLGRPITIWWSNYYWKTFRAPRYSASITEKEKKKDTETIKEYIKRTTDTVMKRFTYKHDGIDELGDSTPPPPEIYAQYADKNKEDFRDDCDGYHSCLYHFASQSGIDCRLVTILSNVNKYGHCVLGYTDEYGLQHIMDYRTDYTGDTLDDIIIEHYHDCTDGAWLVFETKYDYEKNKLVNIPRERYAFEYEKEKEE